MSRARLLIGNSYAFCRVCSNKYLLDILQCLARGAEQNVLQEDDDDVPLSSCVAPSLSLHETSFLRRYQFHRDPSLPRFPLPALSVEFFVGEGVERAFFLRVCESGSCGGGGRRDKNKNLSPAIILFTLFYSLVTVHSRPATSSFLKILPRRTS